MHLSRLHLRVRNNRFNGLVIIGIRFLVGLGFMPSGWVKLMGERFTTIGTDNPVGLFFETLYGTGTYWQFLGASQLLTALLLFTQRFATVGALMFMGIMLNIFTITISLDFQGTPWITGAMLFAAIVLVAWDWHKLRHLWTDRTSGWEGPYPEPGKLWQYGGLMVFVGLVLAMVGLRG